MFARRHTQVQHHAQGEYHESRVTLEDVAWMCNKVLKEHVTSPRGLVEAHRSLAGDTSNTLFRAARTLLAKGGGM